MTPPTEIQRAIRSATLAENQRLIRALLHEALMAEKLGLTECASILDTLAVRFKLTPTDEEAA